MVLGIKKKIISNFQKFKNGEFDVDTFEKAVCDLYSKQGGANRFHGEDRRLLDEFIPVLDRYVKNEVLLKERSDFFKSEQQIREAFSQIENQLSFLNEKSRRKSGEPK